MKPEPIMIGIACEPSKETLELSKLMIEMWLNADSRRNILVKERYRNDREEVYLELVAEGEE